MSKNRAAQQSLANLEAGLTTPEAHNHFVTSLQDAEPLSELYTADAYRVVVVDVRQEDQERPGGGEAGEEEGEVAGSGEEADSAREAAESEAPEE